MLLKHLYKFSSKSRRDVVLGDYWHESQSLDLIKNFSFLSFLLLLFPYSDSSCYGFTMFFHSQVNLQWWRYQYHWNYSNFNWCQTVAHLAPRSWWKRDKKLSLSWKRVGVRGLRLCSNGFSKVAWSQGYRHSTFQISLKWLVSLRYLSVQVSWP